MTLTINGSDKDEDGLIINRGTLAVSNYSRLRHGSPTTINNKKGIVRVACRGSGPASGVTGVQVAQDPCFWDGGGVTNNWSEAANWDANVQ